MFLLRLTGLAEQGERRAERKFLIDVHVQDEQAFCTCRTMVFTASDVILLSKVQLCDFSGSQSDLTPCALRRKNLHGRTEAEQPCVKLRADCYVHAHGEMLVPIGNEHDLFTETVYHGADELIGEAQLHFLLAARKHPEHLC